MKKNMGNADRVIRLVLGIAGLIVAVALGGFWWIAGGLGVVFLATSALGFCPLYLPFGVSTRRESAA